ncbi:MAG: peptidoglycan-binding protein [Magnetovibrio sp.]|nr:peptidoglycan-binding protein [Magnetovibrio sp.]
MRPFGQLSRLVILISLATAHTSGASVLDDGTFLVAEGLASFETAAGIPSVISQPNTRTNYPASLIRKIQQGLANQGFFLGAVDGAFGPKTEQAIRAYQQSAELFIDGVPSQQLAKDLETGGKVSKLLKRLKKSRNNSASDARASLMARPETRFLLENADQDPTAPHNTKDCMANPNPKCLLIEASDSAGNIEKSEMRDWALGEILVSQARAGLASDALGTTRRIHDPRLIIVALREIAKAQATAGDTAAAMAAVDIIPDLSQQVQAYVAIAEIQAQHGNIQDAAETSKHLVRYLARIDSPLTRVTIHTRIASILHKAKNRVLSQKHIAQAENIVRTIQKKKDRDEGQRHIAGAYADIGNPAQAMALLKTVKSGSEDAPVLIAAATKLAQTGELDQAIITAQNIEAMRYRALVLARIASYQAGAGDLVNSRTTMDQALAAAEIIKFPFAKAYAYSRIALALNDVSISADNDQMLLYEALKIANLIKDERLKAHIFWAITDTRTLADDAKGTKVAKHAATSATQNIKSPFSRVWMLCDIAEERAKNGNIDAAWLLFDDAFEETKSISNPWGRARALSKVAGAMTLLADQTSKIANRR